MVLRPRALLLGSHGLGSSEFARHYFRNHGCFLFLPVLRWFTSRGSLRHPMDSDDDTWCSHQVGSPIRTSPDHSLFAAPRGFSQLTTSFFACLRLGIPTHALSSLTIKSIACTIVASSRSPAVYLLHDGFLWYLPINIQFSKNLLPHFLEVGIDQRPDSRRPFTTA